MNLGLQPQVGLGCQPLGEVFDMRPIYDQLTPAVIRDAARVYLDANRYVKVTLMPEAK